MKGFIWDGPPHLSFVFNGCIIVFTTSFIVMHFSISTKVNEPWGSEKKNKTRMETVCIVFLCVLQQPRVPKHVQHCVIASCWECFTTGPSFLALFHCAVWVLTANCIHCLILKPPAGSFQALWHVFPSLSQVQVGPLSAVPRHRLVPRLSASLTPAEGRGQTDGWRR